MGQLKKERNRVSRTASSSSSKDTSKLGNVLNVKGVNFYRDAKQVRQLNMYRGGRAVRDRDGKIVKEAIFQTKLKSGSMARVDSNRRWFGKIEREIAGEVESTGELRWGGGPFEKKN